MEGRLQILAVHRSLLPRLVVISADVVDNVKRLGRPCTASRPFRPSVLGCMPPIRVPCEPSLLADDATPQGIRESQRAHILDSAHLVAQVGETDAVLVVGESQLASGAVVAKASGAEQGPDGR